MLAAIADGGGSLFVSGIDPGWGNDILPVLVSGLASTIDQVRCQEIFDYTTYDQPDSVRFLVGMGQPMDEEPPMVAPTIPTMVWGGQLRLIARALGVELDDIVETVDRRALEETVENAAMGDVREGHPGRAALRGAGHRRRRAPDRRRARHPHPPVLRARLAVPPDGGDGAHRVIIEGRPRIEVNIEATDEGGNRAAGGNATAVGRLVNAIPWLRAAEPRPLRRARRTAQPRRRQALQIGDRMIIDVPEGKDPSATCGARWSPGSAARPPTFSLKVYSDCTLGLREFEAARLRIAQINGCLFCQDWRTERDGEKVEDSFDRGRHRVAHHRRLRRTYAAGGRVRRAATPSTTTASTTTFWERMLAEYDQREIVELSMCLGSWLAFGRLNRVLGLDAVCVLPSHLSTS